MSTPPFGLRTHEDPLRNSHDSAAQVNRVVLVSVTLIV